MSVLILTIFWNICVELALYGLLVTRVLKCFVTPTLAYTTQVDESVLNICIETQPVIDYLCWICFVTTASDSRIKMLCYADFNIHRSRRRKCVTYLYWNSTGYWLYVLYLLCQYVKWLAYFFQILCYVDFKIYLSSRRKCYMSVLILTRFLSMCWTSFARTASSSSIKMLC